MNTQSCLHFFRITLKPTEGTYYDKLIKILSPKYPSSPVKHFFKSIKHKLIPLSHISHPPNCITSPSSNTKSKLFLSPVLFHYSLLMKILSITFQQHALFDFYHSMFFTYFHLSFLDCRIIIF